MIERLLVPIVALSLGSPACGSSSRSSERDAGGDNAAMNVAAAPLRDAGSDKSDAMVDGPQDPANDAAVADAGDAAAQQAAADSGAEHAATAGHSAGRGGAGGQMAGAAAGQSGGAAGAAAAAPEVDPKSFASGLSELFVDMPCDPATPTPLPEGMACSHAANTQSYEKTLTFGGKPGTHYTLTLRLRAIWEPTEIVGGQDPYPGAPFTIGGSPPLNSDGTPTNAINYQQFQIQVADPAQTYWLNNYHAAAHDIRREDYQASIEVAAGSEIKIIVHDGNDLEIGNFRGLMFSDFPPYDKTPSVGQSVRFDVIAVEPRPRH